MSQKGALVSSQHTQPDTKRSHSIDLIVHGATGRMGRRIIDLAQSTAPFRLVATASSAGLRAGAHAPAATSERPGETAENPRFHADFAGRAHLVIDFSSDAGTRAAIDTARRAGAALLTGSTGLTQPTIDALRKFSADRPVLAAPNTSTGVTVLARLAAQAAALAKDFDAAILETHHIGKKDAPSGTALRLAAALRHAGFNLPDDHIVAVRVGQVIGEHIIRFEGPAESVEIIHRAHSRDLFAVGALSAGAWLARQPPGWYTMEDALGFATERP